MRVQSGPLLGGCCSRAVDTGTSCPGTLCEANVFKNLSSRLTDVSNRLRGRGRLSEENIHDAIRDVRRALLEADVALTPVRRIIERVKLRALGQEVARSVSPGQAFIKILHDELVVILGGKAATLDLRRQPPAVIMLVGLQGVGKTTTAAKLARLLSERDKRKVMLASLDTRRPAAMLQLQQLATQIGVPCLQIEQPGQPAVIASRAIDEARRALVDVLILDTAGRTRLEADLLDELSGLHQLTAPSETLFIVDSMAGQDAVNAVLAFRDAVPLTGLILTKVDGDARGGAALSASEVTACPIKFIGSGEALESLESFHPERMASRILGMGDVLGLVEEAGRKVDRKKAQRLARKVKKGRGFDLNDLREQLEQMLSMGGMPALLEKLPLPGKIDTEAVARQMDTRALQRQVALINAMTPSERGFPKSINGSRKRRIAAGTGLAVQDVNRLLKQYMQMQKLMKRAAKGGIQRMLHDLGGAQHGAR